jgi:hypothetical protein
MDRRSIRNLAALISLAALLSPSSAFADQKGGNQPSATAADSNATLKAAMDKYREDQKTFQDLMKVYEEKRRAINKVFKDSVDKALSDARAVSAPGQTQLQKRQSVANKQSAVMAATAIRDAAIEALGMPPVPPTPPAKAPKVEKNKKPGTQSSPPQPAN